MGLAYTNGSGQRDDGADRDTHVKPCCKRIEGRSWCTLPEGHAGRCIGVASDPPKPPDFGPRKKP